MIVDPEAIVLSLLAALLYGLLGYLKSDERFSPLKLLRTLLLSILVALGYTTVDPSVSLEAKDAAELGFGTVILEQLLKTLVGRRR
ncbi:MAG: hypothetical protein NZ920_01220 [Aigarchaeota archaeon]|nr:hypothetical protein [Aigarchaeota archaeon]MDW8093061.1 hypothetical protein [Nitrososphaerota archaeon]